MQTIKPCVQDSVIFHSELNTIRSGLIFSNNQNVYKLINIYYNLATLP